MTVAVGDPSGAEGIAHPLCDGGAPGWAAEWGEDSQFGPYAILELPRRGGGKPVRQRWRWIPAGSFQMGSAENEPGRWNDEGPRHWVRLTRGYWMMDTACTQALWCAVMTDEGNPSYFQDPERPVEQVSWNDVARFVVRLNGLIDGLASGLPTEAQWEYACRAGSDSALYRTAGTSGAIEIVGTHNAPALDGIAWYGGNSGVDFELKNGVDSSGWSEKQYAHRRAGSRKVGKKMPNGWGLYDMLGNVLEWCDDSMRDYGGEMVVDPRGASTESRAIRGGSWDFVARGVRCAYRYQYSPEGRDYNLGFRLVRVQDK